MSDSPRGRGRLLGATAQLIERVRADQSARTRTEERKQDIEAELLEAEVEARQTENAARRFDITERQAALIWRSVFFCITVILIGITVYCYLDGSHKTIPLVTGPCGIGTAAASLGIGRPKKKPLN
jgi:hypothetical protein